MNSRLAEWVQKYGRIPEDATHFRLYDTETSIDIFDIKKLDDGKVYAWTKDDKWRHSLTSIEELNDPEDCMPLTRLDMWKATFGEVPDGATHIRTESTYLSSCDIKKLDDDGQVLFWGAISKGWVPSDLDARNLADESKFQCLTPPDHATARVEEWIAAHGPLPSDATHVISYGCLDLCLYKIVGEAAYFWSKDFGWTESCIDPNSPTLRKIPEKFLTRPESVDVTHPKCTDAETIKKIEGYLVDKYGLTPTATNSERVVGAVIDWVAEFGDLPDGTTHLSRRLMYGPHMSDAVYRLSDSACYYWDFKTKSWLTPVLDLNELGLVRIPEANARRTADDTPTFPVAAISDQSFPYHLGGNYGG